MRSRSLKVAPQLTLLKYKVRKLWFSFKYLFQGERYASSGRIYFVCILFICIQTQFRR